MSEQNQHSFGIDAETRRWADRRFFVSLFIVACIVAAMAALFSALWREDQKTGPRLPNELLIEHGGAQYEVWIQHGGAR